MEGLLGLKIRCVRIMIVYGMPIREIDEAGTVAWLMRLYQEKVAELEKEAAEKKKK